MKTILYMAASVLFFSFVIYESASEQPNQNFYSEGYHYGYNNVKNYGVNANKVRKACADNLTEIVGYSSYSNEREVYIQGCMDGYKARTSNQPESLPQSGEVTPAQMEEHYRSVPI